MFHRISRKTAAAAIAVTALALSGAVAGVRQPLERIAEETVRLLLALIDGADRVEPVILPTTLVVREST